MTDTTKQRPLLDRDTVNLSEPREVELRRKQYGCTELQLKQAVAAVGVSVDRVTQYFRNKSTPPKGGKQRYE